MRTGRFHEKPIKIKSAENSTAVRKMEKGFLRLEIIEEEDIIFLAEQLEREIRQEMNDIHTDTDAVIFILDALNAEGLFRPESTVHINEHNVARIRKLTGDSTLELENDKRRLRISGLYEDESGELKPETMADKDDPVIYNAVARIRRAVLEQLKQRLAENEDPQMDAVIHSVDHVIKWSEESTEYNDEKGRKKDSSYEKATVVKLDGEHVLKINPDWAAKYVEDNHDALTHLYNQAAEGNASPYVSYHLLGRDMSVWETFDEETGEDAGDLAEALEVFRELDMNTIDELLYQKDLPPLQTTVRYWSEFMRAADFCLNNGLILTDLTLDNIQVDRRTDTGQAFDLGSLNTRTFPQEGYSSKTDYHPPETKDSKMEIFGEAQNIYELGVGLDFILDVYEVRETELVYEERHAEIAEDLVLAAKLSKQGLDISTLLPQLRRLAKRMTDNNPKRRPTMDSCYAELYRIGVLQYEGAPESEIVSFG